MPFDEDKVPTRAEILEHAQGDINKLVAWLDTLDLPVGAREAILSDLSSYDYLDDRPPEIEIHLEQET